MTKIAAIILTTCPTVSQNSIRVSVKSVYNYGRVDVVKTSIFKFKPDHHIRGRCFEPSQTTLHSRDYYIERGSNHSCNLGFTNLGAQDLSAREYECAIHVRA